MPCGSWRVKSDRTSWTTDEVQLRLSNVLPRLKLFQNFDSIEFEQLGNDSNRLCEGETTAHERIFHSVWTGLSGIASNHIDGAGRAILGVDLGEHFSGPRTGRWSPDSQRSCQTHP